MRAQRLIAGAVLMANLGWASPGWTVAPKDFPEGERLVFARIVSAFRANQLDEARRQREVLKKNYPRSIHLGHAHYLNGVLEFQEGNLAAAAREFGVVINEFPRSRQRPAALFAKAATYDRLNLRPLALELWRRVASDYPGSREAQRAGAQLKLEQLGAKVK